MQPEYTHRAACTRCHLGRSVFDSPRGFGGGDRGIDNRSFVGRWLSRRGRAGPDKSPLLNRLAEGVAFESQFLGDFPRARTGRQHLLRLVVRFTNNVVVAPFLFPTQQRLLKNAAPHVLAKPSCPVE
jgi:hypothetical protein